MKVINSDNYKILIGEDSLKGIDISRYSKIGILIDENTKTLCLPILIKEQPCLKKSLIIEIKSGEDKKNIKTCNYIWEELLNNNFERDALLINLGGGVIGDIGGFCAATFKRGIDFMHIPTTLLAMVDATIGGKLGVDINGLKNSIGLFKNPASVIINPMFIKTLEEDQLKFGLSEVVKHALIADIELWKHLVKTNIEDFIWEDIITHSILIKNKIVINDFKEEGERKKLNFGHTYGHAIESYYLLKETPILHGQAIILGILMESKMSELNTLEKNEITSYILSNYELPHSPPKDQLISLMLNDKKNKQGRINFSLLKGIGDCSINNLFNADEL